MQGSGDRSYIIADSPYARYSYRHGGDAVIMTSLFGPVVKRLDETETGCHEFLISLQPLS